MKKPTRVIEWNDEAQDEMLSQPGAAAETGHGAWRIRSPPTPLRWTSRPRKKRQRRRPGPPTRTSVRLYLRNIGKRKLLTAADERVIGARMERARAELLVALADLPAPRQALIRMAAALRNRELEVPELILNPDGKPVTRAGVAAVLEVIDALARSEKRRKLGDHVRSRWPREWRRSRSGRQSSKGWSPGTAPA